MGFVATALWAVFNMFYDQRYNRPLAGGYSI
jgi:hypothetical protein